MAKAKRKTVTASAHCPHCRETTEWVWDGYLRAARCPCGMTVEDFDVRMANRLWDDDAKAAFEAAVRAGGRAWAGDRGVGSNAGGPAPLPAAPSVAPAERSEYVNVHCPHCGRFLRSAYPPTTETCFDCGTDVTVDERGRIGCRPLPGVRCERCRRILTRNPVLGAIYQCFHCGVWSPGDGRSRDAANRERNRRDEQAGNRRDGLLPGTVLAQIRSLADRECGNRAGRDHCLVKPDGVCVFRRAETHRCRWFERAVLPLKPDLERMYWRDYRTEARAAAGGDASAEEVEKAARKLARDAKAAREKTCPRCGRRFVPPENARKTRYCELCRADVRREKARERKRRERAYKTGKEPGVVCHALLK